MTVAAIVKLAPKIMENLRPSPSAMYGANGYAHSDPMLFEERRNSVTFHVPKMEATDLDGVQQT